MSTTWSQLSRLIARHGSFLLAMAFGSALAHIATTGMPLQIGALMDGTARTASQAGLFAFIEVAALSGGMILVSILPNRMTPFRVAITGSLVASLGNMGLFLARDFRVQLFLAAWAGLGFGLAYSATIAAGASGKNADRTYAIGFGGSLLLVVLIMAILPFMSARFGLLGVFACLAGFALICTPLFRGFKGSLIVREAGAAAVQPAVWQTDGAAGLLFSWAAFSTGTAAVYVFAERIGRNISLPPTDIAFILSSGVFIGVLGTLLAAVLSERLSRRTALIVGLLGSALACLLVGHATTLKLFVAGVYSFWIFTMFLYCFLLGTAAVLDKTGRLGTLGSGTERLGYGIGAWIGGILVEHISFSSAGTFACAACLSGVLLGYPTLFRALSVRNSQSLATAEGRPTT